MIDLRSFSAAFASRLRLWGLRLLILHDCPRSKHNHVHPDASPYRRFQKLGNKSLGSTYKFSTRIVDENGIRRHRAAGGRVGDGDHWRSLGKRVKPTISIGYRKV